MYVSVYTVHGCWLNIMVRLLLWINRLLFKGVRARLCVCLQEDFCKNSLKVILQSTVRI